MIISIIAAVSKNNIIGNKGKIPWHISEDFKHFKDITSGHVVVMGQKTFESIGKPLPERTNVVLTTDPIFKAEGCEIVYSPEEALDKAKNKNETEVFIIGGGQIYKIFLPIADKLYLTKIDKEFDGDTRFPDFNQSEWHILEREKKYSEKEDLYFEFLTLKKK